MQLGFVSAILPELSLEDLVRFAATEGFQCVELMCWPRGKADRRYAGVTHLDVLDMDRAKAGQVRQLMQSAGITISGLGYYPNLLAPDDAEAVVYAEHLKRVIVAAELLGVGVVNTFAGRDPRKTVAENWPRFLDVWRPLVSWAEERGVRIAIENCPMFFTADEWPGGKNLAVSPAIWRQMFADIPSPNFGLNYDPSHLVWQQIDHVRPLAEFAARIFHVHLKDSLVELHRLNEVGILATPLEYHCPKLPGRGNVRWPQFFTALQSTGYCGPACIEVEDREFEGSLEARQQALRLSLSFVQCCLKEIDLKKE
jgi:sugar phosphate isomerase/epimerase